MKPTLNRFASLLALFGFTLLAVFAYGQGIVTGSISGTVVDPQGAVVNGANVTATQTSTNRQFSTATTGAGNFSLRSLPIGTYNITVESTNYRAYQATGVGVNASSDTSLGTIKMELGQASQTVTVEGAAPLVESSTQQITNTFNSQQAQDVPVGNTLDSLALFAPGVATAGDASFSNNNGAEISVNGQRERSNNFQIDGQNNNDNSVGGPSIFFGNQDAIAEVQVITNYSAEYGRNMGSVINYITKAGTNTFHGSAYEFYNGSRFDSLTNEEKSPWLGFCLPGQSAAATGCTPPVRSNFVDNRFGGTLGGPIIKDKVWFFGSGNFERQRTAGQPQSSAPLLTPTPTGVSQLQSAFPGNPAVTALAGIGPAAVTGGSPHFSNLQTLLVSATSASCPGAGCVPVQFGYVTRNVPAPYNDYEGTGRVDIKLTSRDNFFARYVFQEPNFYGIATSTGIPAGDWVNEPGRDQQIGLDWTRNWSNNFVNQARFSYSRARFGFEGGSFPNCLQTSISNCPTSISFSDGTTLAMGRATNMPQGRIINVYQLQDNASWQVGNATIKFGGEYDRQRSPNVFLPNLNGSFTFPTFNAFLADTPSAVSIVSGNPRLPFKENDLAFYLENDWRVRDNLTLNLGLRWEWFQQAINLLHDRTVAQQLGPHPFWNPALPLSRTTIPYIPQDLNNFSPVVGFAYTPGRFQRIFGQSQTVIRGGFRMAYDPSFYNMFLNTATRAPVVNSGQFPAPGLTTVPGLPVGGGLGSSIQASILPLVPTGGDPGLRPQTLVAQNFYNPYTLQWNLGIQRSIGSRMAAEVRYVGNHDIGNFLSQNGNPALGPLIAAGFSNVIPSNLHPCSDPTMPGFTDGYVDCTKTRVLLRSNRAYSIYHGLQSELRVANFHGVTATASYTFSKVIDNQSEVYSVGVGGGNTLAFAQDPFNVSGRPERAVSGYDFPHVVGISFIYDLPFFRTGSGFMGKILGGWQFNSTYRYTSGQPYTTIQSQGAGDQVLIGTSLCDPTQTMSTFYDACRPILASATAPLASVGICDPAVIGACSLLDYKAFVGGSSVPVSRNSVHWIVNDNVAAAAFGSPFLGVSRNTNRGQPISTANASMFKNTKLTERLTLQLRATAYNIMNVQFRGVPDPLLDDVLAGSFQNTYFNSNGGATFTGNCVYDGICQRRLEFGAKVIF